MTDTSSSKPTGLIPHLVCSPCADAIDFYKQAFGAEEICRIPSPDGQRMMHAAILIDGSQVMLADDFPEYCGGKSHTPQALGGTSVSIHCYVDDCDAAIRRAEQAGADVTMPPADMFWGDRYGQVTDPFGHVWAFATHLKDLTPEELVEGMNAAFAEGPQHG
jgi:PhnB protein